MARRYWMKVGGAKHFGSLAEVKRAGQRLADKLGCAVQVGYDGTPAARPKPKVSMRRNPVMQGYDFTGEEWKVSTKGPFGQTGYSYANSEAEAKQAARLWRAKGFRVTHMVRLKAPNAPAKSRRRGPRRA